MDIDKVLQRVKAILLTPKTEWPIIAAEPATTGSVITYAAILALIPLVASVLGAVLFVGRLGLGINLVLASAVISYLIGLGILFVMGIIAAALAPSFDGQNSQIQGLKLIVYASTPVYVAGVLQIIPGLNVIASLVGLAYGIYLIYLGARPVVGVPEVKSGGYTAVIVIIWLILQLVVSAIIVTAIMGAFFSGALIAGAAAG